MIYTVTLNPAIDNVIQTEAFQKGHINRACREYIFPGGKGVNVSLVLERLGMETVALGFLAGATGKAYQALLQENGLSHGFLFLDRGFTRINTKVSAEEETEINGGGPGIRERDLDQLCGQLASAGPEDFVVLSGSVPSRISGAYTYILERISGCGAGIVVDTTGEELLQTLKYRPFLIKPNIHELSELCGAAIRTKDELAACVRSLQKAGVRNVLVSMGRDGACLFTEPGEVLYAAGISGKAGNTVGAGDSMVAGFLAGYLTGGSYREALRTGAAAGTATAFSFGIAGEEEITGCMEQVVIEELKI